MEIRYGMLALRFLWVFLAATIAVGAFVIVTGLDTSATSVVPLMAAAMDGGMRMVKKSGRRPTSGEMWILAAVQTIVGIILTVPIMALFFFAAPELAQGLPPIFIMVGVLIVFGINFLLSRVFIWTGVRSGVKQYGVGMPDSTVFQ